MIQDTSIQAYEGIRHKLGPKHNDVLSILRLHENATNTELAQALGWSINTVTPRVNELRKTEYGTLILDAGKRTCRITGRTAHAWKAKSPVLPPAFAPKKPEPQQLLL